MNKILREYRIKHWNNVTNVLEPVGTNVYVLTDEMEVYKAYRKTPADSRDCPNTYYRLSDDFPVDNVRYWSYI